MENLSRSHPDVYQNFVEGMHSIRRSDREWAGLWTDLVIEQTYMRSLKTSGGLTRGSGLSDHQRNIWVLSRPTCAQVNLSMQELTGKAIKTGEQNKDITTSRQDRDWLDMNKIYSVLQDRNPFNISEFMNIFNGEHAHSLVNADNAREIGIKILKDMNG